MVLTWSWTYLQLHKYGGLTEETQQISDKASCSVAAEYKFQPLTDSEYPNLSNKIVASFSLDS